MILKIKDVILTKWNNNKLRPPNDPESIYNLSNISKNLEDLSETFDIIFQDKDNHELGEWYVNSGIVNNWITAVECLAVSRYAPALLFASIAVECAINHDSKMQKIKENDTKHNWINLTNNTVLMNAHKVGIPTEILCDEDESLNDKNYIRFIDRRNKIAHGDYSGYRKIPIMTKSNGILRISKSEQPTREHALYQIEKSKKFILEWAKPTTLILV